MKADLFSVPKTTFLTIRKQQTLNFSYHESSRWQFSAQNQRALKAFRNDPLGAPDKCMPLFASQRLRSSYVPKPKMNNRHLSQRLRMPSKLVTYTTEKRYPVNALTCLKAGKDSELIETLAYQIEQELVFLALVIMRYVELSSSLEFEENHRNFRWKTLKRVENLISLYNETFSTITINR